MVCPTELGSPHTLALVMSAARAISNQLHTNWFLEEANRHLSEVNTILGAITDGVIAWNESGKILHMNEQAGQILGLNPASVVGRPLVEMLALPANLMRAIEEERVIRDDETTFLVGDQSVTCLTNLRPVGARPMTAGLNQPVGHILLLQPIEQVRRLVHQQLERVDRATLAPGQSTRRRTLHVANHQVPFLGLAHLEGPHVQALDHDVSGREVSGAEPVCLRVLSPSGVSANVPLRLAKDGARFHARVRWPEVGRHVLVASINGDAVVGSPTHVDVVAADVHLPSCKVTGPGCVGCVAGERTRFVVEARDSRGNRLCAGGASLSLRVQTPGSEPTRGSVLDQGDGTYAASYAVDKAGPYVLVLSAGVGGSRLAAGRQEGGECHAGEDRPAG